MNAAAEIAGRHVSGRGVPRAFRGPFTGAVASEWTKLWSVRAPYICLLAGLGATGLFTFYFGSIASINDHPAQPVGNAAASSTLLGQFVVVILATLAVTGEYTTTSVRTTLLWVPVRHRVQLAKALVAAVVTFVAGVVFAVLGMAVAWGPFGGHATFDAAEAAATALAVGLYYALVAVLTVGAAFAARHAAGALAALFLLLWALPSTLVGLGGPVLVAINDWLPQAAGEHLMRHNAEAPYPPGVAILVLLAWTLAGHLAGRAVLRLRDA
ncbi:ABC transporter permease [Streptomyces longisporoflavus]|uniref:ABC transporter permease n=1 Tax=Streptomyces longisporoflavus TaxID=28044 RepID=A0ABW7QGR3_9ACTN